MTKIQPGYFWRNMAKKYCRKHWFITITVDHRFQFTTTPGSVNLMFYGLQIEMCGHCRKLRGYGKPLAKQMPDGSVLLL
jgi:hypothetical protein